FSLIGFTIPQLPGLVARWSCQPPRRASVMKRIVSLALAGLITVGAVATVVQPAMADNPGHYRYYRPGPPGGHWHGDGGGRNAGGAFVGGTIPGLALGTALSSPPPPAYIYVAPPPPPVVVYPYPRYVYASSAHIAWCTSHYPTYNGETDTFIGL